MVCQAEILDVGSGTKTTAMGKLQDSVLYIVK